MRLKKVKMKYKVKQTDIFLKGQVVPEGTIIDSNKYSEEDIESVEHLLEEVEKTSTTLEEKTKRPRNKTKIN